MALLSLLWQRALTFCKDLASPKPLSAFCMLQQTESPPGQGEVSLQSLPKGGNLIKMFV